MRILFSAAAFLDEFPKLGEHILAVEQLTTLGLGSTTREPFFQAIKSFVTLPLLSLQEP
jgi:hypothetical protein